MSFFWTVKCRGLPEEFRGNTAYRWFEDFNCSTDRVARRRALGQPAVQRLMLLPGIVGSGTPCGKSPAGPPCRSPLRRRTHYRRDGNGKGTDRRPSISSARGPTSPLSSSIARQSLRHWWRPNSLVIPVELSRVPYSRASERFMPPRAGAFSSTNRRTSAGHQAKLLRFLECGEVQRLGTSDVFRLDVRVIAATNVDLEKRVQQGSSAKTSFIALTSFPSSCRPYANVWRIFPCSRGIFWSG